jgi:hypothetical protein
LTLTRNEMTMTGMLPQAVEQVMGLLNLQLAYARTGEGWDECAATREKTVAKMGAIRGFGPRG